MLTRVCAAMLLLTLLTACGDDSDPEADEPASTSSPIDRATDSPTARTETAPSKTPGPTDHGTRIVSADSDFGSILFDATGQAIYLFDLEPTAKPGCYGACAEAWPPVLTQGEPRAGLGVERSLLGTTERTDGALQVTYNNHPLYFYAHEGKREVKCHDVFLNGGNWYVVQPDGDPVPPV